MIGDLLVTSVIIAIGFLIAVAFYESLSTRDVFVGRTLRFVRRFSTRPWIVGLAYGLTVGVGIPVLVVTWSLVLARSSSPSRSGSGC